MKKVCVFIDGENLRHSIVELFENNFNPSDYLPKNAEWEKFYDWLTQQVSSGSERVRAYWYVIQHLDSFPYKFPDPFNESEELKKLLSKYKPYKDLLDQTPMTNLQTEMSRIVDDLRDRESKMRSRFAGWITIQNGIATHHDGIEFRRAGAIRYNLFDKTLGPEKAVDVKLAVDLIVLHQTYDIAVIVSGDQDYVPAVQVIKDYGKRVINVVFKRRDGSFLPSGAWRLNQITDKVLEIEYGKLKNFLNLP